MRKHSEGADREVQGTRASEAPGARGGTQTLAQEPKSYFLNVPPEPPGHRVKVTSEFMCKILAFLEMFG